MSVLKIKNELNEWEEIPTIQGKDAKINGVNALNLLAGENINIEQEGSDLTISSTGGYDDTEVWETIDEHDRDIQNIENDIDGLVNDVQIDGVSIVQDKIANIDFTNKTRSVRPKVVTANPGLLEVNTLYTLGEQTSLTIQLPSGQVGDFLEIQFISKTTPTTLNIISSYGMTDLDLIPETNTIYNIYGEWGLIDVDTYGWFLKYADAPIPSIQEV